MKLLRQVLCKTIIGAGLSIAPVVSNAQNINASKTNHDVITGGGVSYAIGTPDGVYDITMYGNYGIMSDVFGPNDKLHGMAMALAYGAISNEYENSNNTLSGQLGIKLKIGVGYRNFVLTASKGGHVSFTKDTNAEMTDLYSLGMVFTIGEYTKIYTDWNYTKDVGLIRKHAIHTLDMGIIYTLTRRQK